MRLADARTALRAGEIFLARHSLIQFIRLVAPWFKIEAAHVTICHYLEAAVDGTIPRLMIHMPPRTGKSEIVSKLFIAWYLGKYPLDKVLHASHSKEMIEEFFESISEYIDSDVYRLIFPDVEIAKAKGTRFTIQSKDAGRRGEYRAISVETRVAGFGANLAMIDDPVSEQDFLSPHKRNKIERWYRAGFITRQQPERSIIIIMATRWITDDLPGRLIKLARQNPDADQWTVLSIPAFVNMKTADVINAIAKREDHVEHDPLLEGQSFLPRRFSKRFLNGQKANLIPEDWGAQYMQKPMDVEGNILKKALFEPWKGELPDVDLQVTFWDTAYLEKETADYTARSTYGVFRRKVTFEGQEFEQYRVILLDANRERIDAAELPNTVVRYQQEVGSDHIVIEDKGSGITLLQELQTITRIPLPVQPWLPPAPGTDKVARASITAGILYWAPLYVPDADWAKELIDEALRFPFAPHDDLTDTLTMMAIWMRSNGLLGTPMDVLSEEDQKDQDLAPKVKKATYG